MNRLFFLIKNNISHHQRGPWPRGDRARRRGWRVRICRGTVVVAERERHREFVRWLVVNLFFCFLKKKLELGISDCKNLPFFLYMYMCFRCVPNRSRCGLHHHARRACARQLSASRAGHGRRQHRAGSSDQSAPQGHAQRQRRRPLPDDQF
jgi:hypothetical protein